MDRNTITGLGLIFVIFIGASLFNNSRVTKAFEKSMHSADSLYEAGKYELARTEYLKALNYKPNAPAAAEKVNEINGMFKPVVAEGLSEADTLAITEEPVTSPVQEQAVTRSQPESQEYLGQFSGTGTGSQEFITIENDKVEIKISTKGGRIYSARIKDYYTFDSKPLILFDGDSTVFGLNFFTADNKAIKTNDLYFSLYDTDNYIDASKNPGTAVLRLNTVSGGYIEYKYTLEPDEYMLEYYVSFVGLTNIIAANQNAISLDWKAYIPQQEKGRTNEFNYTQIKYKHFQDDVDGFRERSQKEFEEAEVPTRLRWVSFKDQFFSTAVIAEESFLNGYVTSTEMPEGGKYLKYFTAELGIPYDPAKDYSFQMHIFLGPNHFKTLKKYGYELHEVIFLGKNIIRWINQYVIIQIFSFLNKYISNYGIIILILTLIIKTALYPLTFKSYQSQAKMKVLKPMVDEIGKKFPKKEDALKKQQATMDMYKKAGVSPLGGCLPMALQMPILFAMFRFFPASIELRQESFLWAKDLSTYDSILDLPFTIPMYGDHISLFTLLMTVSTILTTRLNSPASTGQEQVPGMKMMMYMMPVMFMLILNNFSSGLTYYYFLANIITLGQNWISKRFIDENAVLSKLEANKKKPATKSKFQQRLEEAAKQRGIRPKK